MAERTCYDKLRSLQSKGCIQVVSSERDGTRIRLHLPREIEGVIPNSIAMVQPNLEDIDFFTAPENRLAILRSLSTSFGSNGPRARACGA